LFGHLRQAVAALAFEYSPNSHCAHGEDPFSTLYVPGGHEKQTLVFPEYPGLQRHVRPVDHEKSGHPTQVEFVVAPVRLVSKE
jgi:hypothetical protein